MKSNPLVIIAAISVIILSLVGVAAVTGLLPSAISQKTETEAKVKTNKPLQNKPQHKLANACINCGVIESIKTIETKGDGTGLGAVAGGVAGAVVGNQFGKGDGKTAITVAGAAGGAYAGHEIEKHVKRTVKYQITVKMEDGSSRILSQDKQPSFSVGQKVKIIDGAIVPGSVG